MSSRFRLLLHSFSTTRASSTRVSPLAPLPPAQLPPQLRHGVCPCRAPVRPQRELAGKLKSPRRSEPERAHETERDAFRGLMLLLPSSSLSAAAAGGGLIEISPSPFLRVLCLFCSIRHRKAIRNVTVRPLAKRRGQYCRDEEARRLALSDSNRGRRSKNVDSKKNADGGCYVIGRVFSPSTSRAFASSSPVEHQERSFLCLGGGLDAARARSFPIRKRFRPSFY